MLKTYSLSFSVLLTLSALVLAGKPAKRITEFQAADVTFADGLNDVVSSDGLGTYMTGVDGFEAYSEYGRTEILGGGQLAALHLKDFVSGDPAQDPSGPIEIIHMRHLVHNHTVSDPQESFPAPGTVVQSSVDKPQSVFFEFVGADGNEYLISAWDDTGAISLTSNDLNSDGNADVNVVEASTTLEWILYIQSVETVVVGKGKKQTTEERVVSTPVATYTGMSLQMHFELLGYRIQQFGLR